MKRIHWIFLTVAVASLGGGLYWKFHKKTEPVEEITVAIERFQTSVAESGTVQPEHKISIMAQIAGRIDKIMVEEGKSVRRGQIIAWMSSTDRAALLDSAASQGKKALDSLIDVYKPTPIIAPTSGVIINTNVVEGQTVAGAASLFDLSDRLVVVSDVDETDLGKISVGQKAIVKVDSFADRPVNATVTKIAHASVTKNSINVYEVQLDLEKVPDEFRAGLTASVYFAQQDIENALLLPAWVAEGRENFETTLKVKREGAAPEIRTVKFGTSNGQKVLVKEGLQAGEVVLVEKQKVLSGGSKSTNPFAPTPARGGRRR